MRKYIHSAVIILLISASLSPTPILAKGDNNFCFNGDIAEAQINAFSMCATAPILICPSGYFGCPQDDVDPSTTGMAFAIPGDPNCPAAIVTYSDEIVSNTNCQVEIHRKWHAEYPPGTANPWLYSECMQIIINQDTLAPVIANCPADIVLDLSALCDSTATWQEPSVSDNCDLFTLSSTHASGDTFSHGSTTVSYTAQDSCMNSAMCSFTVSVVETC